MTIPVGGLEVIVSQDPRPARVRGVVVQVDEALMGDFARIAAEGTASNPRETRTYSAAQWNTAVAELWSIGSVIADPEGTINRPAGAGADAAFEVRFPARVPDARLTSRAVVEVITGAGAPVIGIPLLVTAANRLSLDPSREGITAQESERRTWALAVYESVAQLGQRAVIPAPAERAGGVHPAVWAAGVVLVGAAVYAVVQHLTDRVEVNAQLARDTALIAAGARAYEQRLVQWRQTGTMPEASEAERTARALADQRANAGWTRFSSAASDVLRDTGRTVNSLLKWGAIGAGLYLLASKQE